jgi:hypothetical protein
MSEETILKLVTIITPAIVAVIGLLLRAYLIGLGKEVDQLRATIASLHAVVLKAQSTAVPTPDEPYTAMPPYRKPGK